MFIDKNELAYYVKKNSNDNLEKKIPVTGIFKINLKKINFDMLVINSDDTSISRRFWNDQYTDYTLDKWCSWCEEEGIYIDVGAHTGLYTVAALISNKKNFLVSFEPFLLNYHRIITNLRLNDFNNSNAKLFDKAVSDENKLVKFQVNTAWSYLSKGGKINNSGKELQAIKLDSLNFLNSKLDIKGIKIDAEGEDLKVILGAEKIIKKYMPKIVIECRVNNILEITSYLSNLGYKNIYDKDGNFFGSNQLLQVNGNVKNLFFEKS